MCSCRQRRFFLAGSLFEGQFIFTFDFYYLMPTFSGAQVLKPFVLRILMLTHFAVVILLLEVHNIFITSIEGPKLRDWKRFNNISQCKSCLCHFFFFSFSLRRLLIPSYLTMSERHCDIHGTYHPERLGISITTPLLSLIYIYLSVASILNSPWAAEVSLLKTCMALNFKKGARFRQALGSTNRPLYLGREWRLLSRSTLNSFSSPVRPLFIIPTFDYILVRSLVTFALTLYNSNLKFNPMSSLADLTRSHCSLGALWSPLNCLQVPGVGSHTFVS